MSPASTPPPRTLVIAPIGELDLASGSILEQSLLRAEASGVRHLLVDLSGIEFIDSSGLHVLLRAHERAVTDGRRLSLTPGPDQVQRLFELLRLEHTLHFEPTPLDPDHEVIPLVLHPRTAFLEQPSGHDDT